MSGGAVLNEAGQLVGIHVGLTKVGGDGKGVLISTFLRMVSPEVEEVLVRPTPDVLPSSSSDNEEVKLRRQLEEERRKREEAEGQKQEGVIKKWFCLRRNWWLVLVWVLVWLILSSLENGSLVLLFFWAWVSWWVTWGVVGGVASGWCN
jgi:hypothetical protein